jgi:hypothetical protein
MNAYVGLVGLVLLCTNVTVCCVCWKVIISTILYNEGRRKRAFVFEIPAFVTLLNKSIQYCKGVNADFANNQYET